MSKFSFLKITFIGLIATFLLIQNAIGSTPSQNVSGLNQCYYKIVGKTSNNTAYNTPWTLTNCETNLDFTALGIPDGTYTVQLKGNDNTATGTLQSFAGEPASDPTNKYGITYWPNPLDANETYKIDTTAPSCVLKEIRFLSGSSENQYYNNDKFYFKSVGGSGKFELVIESDDTNNGANTNVSNIDKIQFPTILGDTPVTQTFTNSGKVVVVGRYEWSGNNTDSYDILNNASKLFCFDNSGNSASLGTNANTKLVIQDGNHIVNGITKLILTPDSDEPTVAGAVFNQFSNGVEFKSGNNGAGPFVSIFAGASPTNGKVFSALSNRELSIPAFRDVGSGLKSFNIKIEQHNNPTGFTTYPKPLSTQTTKVTDMTGTGIIHDFSLVDNDYNGTSGYRVYTWNIETLNLGGAVAESNKVCDMVGNCVVVDTPDFKVVSNEPVIASNTNLITGTVGSKHNLDANYTANSTSMRSNMHDSHNTMAVFEDQYGNRIVPVSGVKDVRFNVVFDNTLGCDQYNTPGSGDCVDILFKNGTNILNSSNAFPVAGEKHNFLYTFNNYTQFVDGEVSLQLKSAIPTKDEYKLGATTTSLYGSLTAKMQMENFRIKIDNKTAYGGIGENGSFLELANSGANKPDYKWFPIINFNEIADIYPLVEGQEKSLTLKDIYSGLVGDVNLPVGYKLETKIGTNNFFLQFKNIYLSAGNTATGSDNYDIMKDTGFLTTYGNGTMNYNSNDIYNFLPKTIGGISNNSTKLALHSKLNYLIGGRYVSIPSIQTGFGSFGPHVDADFTNDANYDSNSDITLAEIDVRGKTQTKNDGGTGVGSGAVATTSTFKDTSMITLYNFKTAINQNVDKVLNGLNRSNGIISGGQYTLSNLSSFPNVGINTQNGKVLYFKDTDVTIDCSGVCNVTGNKTIIVENGNIFLKSDMKYNDASSILGFILIGNKDTGSKSQFRISNRITNGVGLIYSDGPIISVDNSNAIIYDGSSVVNTKLANQLYWKGSFATKNTVGGAIKDANGNCPYGTPDYKKPSCTIEKAQGYDLIYLRRYARLNKSLYGVSNDPMGDGKIPANIDKVSVKLAGGDEYSQVATPGPSNKTPGTLPTPAKNNLNAPLILEYDNRVQTNPPTCF